MANYTCLLLDVDNTLLDFIAAERAAVGITLEHYGMPNGPEALETYHQINRQLWDSLAKGELNRSKLFAVWPRDAGSWHTGSRQRPRDERLL